MHVLLNICCSYFFVFCFGFRVTGFRLCGCRWHRDVPGTRAAAGQLPTQEDRKRNETKSERKKDTELKKTTTFQRFRVSQTFLKFETCVSPLFLKTRGNSTWQNMWITRRSGQPVNSVDLVFLVGLSQGNVIINDF